ncbi:MAG: divergent polysaccharide deacetylase family protein, partial [Pseudomonadota bacterium]
LLLAVWCCSSALAGDLKAPAAEAPARLAPRYDERALLAIVIDDMGLDWARFRAVMAIDAPLTLSFLPYGKDAQAMLDIAADQHDVLLHLPMQPFGDLDAGPDQVTLGKDAAVRRQVNNNLEKLTGYHGVNNHMGSRVTADRQTMRSVLDVLNDKGLFFLDSRTSTRSVSSDVAPLVGARVIENAHFIDGEAGRGGKREALRQLTLGAQVAKRDGSAVVIGHPYPMTIAALEAWLQTDEAKSIKLVKLSTLLPESEQVSEQSPSTLRF